ARTSRGRDVATAREPYLCSAKVTRTERGRFTSKPHAGCRYSAGPSPASAGAPRQDRAGLSPVTSVLALRLWLCSNPYLAQLLASPGGMMLLLCLHCKKKPVTGPHRHHCSERCRRAFGKARRSQPRRELQHQVLTSGYDQPSRILFEEAEISLLSR